MSNKYPWVEKCDRLQRGGVSYSDLAERFGVTRGVIAGVLHRHRNPTGDASQYYRTRAKPRFWKILKGRQEAVQKLLDSGIITDPAHIEALKAHAEGLDNQACGARVGYSHAWASLVFKMYGLDRRRRFSSATREQAFKEREKI